jgi:hypothetical protein
MSLVLFPVQCEIHIGFNIRLYGGQSAHLLFTRIYHVYVNFSGHLGQQECLWRSWPLCNGFCFPREKKKHYKIESCLRKMFTCSILTIRINFLSFNTHIFPSDWKCMWTFSRHVLLSASHVLYIFILGRWQCCGCVNPNCCQKPTCELRQGEHASRPEC